jgi:hypothetical protein
MTNVGVDWSVHGQPAVRSRYSGSNTYTLHIVGTRSAKEIHFTSFPDTAQGRQDANAVWSLYLEHWQAYTRNKSGLFRTPQTI